VIRTGVLKVSVLLIDKTLILPLRKRAGVALACVPPFLFVLQHFPSGTRLC